jgi:DNA replicative helicase MCM subunit Mcm2 (Cdc46/Mcm family)
MQVMPEHSKYMDQQKLKLQENPEDVPVGEMPRNMMLCIDRSLVQRVVPGTRITLVGIYSIFQHKEKTGRGQDKVSRAGGVRASMNVDCFVEPPPPPPPPPPQSAADA